MNYWKVLGITPTDDIAVIKKTYAALIKEYRPDVNPEKFQEIRTAFDMAKNAVVAVLEEQAAQLPNADTAISQEMTDAIDTLVVSRVDVDQPVDDSYASSEEAAQQIADSDKARMMLDSILAELKPSDASAAIRHFESMLLQDEFLHIDFRKTFECWCMQAATHWHPDAEYPGEIFEYFNEHFEWYSQRNAQPFIQNLWPQFEARIDSWRRWRELLGLVKMTDTYARDVAKMLTGKARPKYFLMHLHANERLKKDIIAYLNQLRWANPSAFDYEFNTPAVRWWLDNADRYSMSSFALLTTFPVLFIAMVSTISFLLPIAPESLLGEFIFWGAIELPLSLILVNGVFYSWHRTRPFLLRKTEIPFARWNEFRTALCARLETRFIKRWIVPPVVVFSCSLPIVWHHPYAHYAMWFVLCVTLFITVILYRQHFLSIVFGWSVTLTTFRLCLRMFDISDKVINSWSSMGLILVGSYIGYSCFVFVRDSDSGFFAHIYAWKGWQNYPIGLMLLLHVLSGIFIFGVYKLLIV